MKSSWELALERTGGALKEISQDKKDKIAEIESIYKAKIAGAEISAREKLKDNWCDKAAIQQINDDLAVEKASYESKMQLEKDKIRG